MGTGTKGALRYLVWGACLLFSLETGATTNPIATAQRWLKTHVQTLRTMINNIPEQSAETAHAQLFVEILLKQLAQHTNDYPKITIVQDKEGYWHPAVRKVFRNEILKIYADLPPIFRETKVRRIIISPQKFMNGSFLSFFGLLEDIHIYMPISETALDEYVAFVRLFDPRPERYYVEYRKWTTHEAIETDIAIHEFLHAFQHNRPDMGNQLLNLRFKKVFAAAEAEREAVLKVATSQIDTEMKQLCRGVSAKEDQERCTQDWKKFTDSLVENSDARFKPFVEKLTELRRVTNAILYPELDAIVQKYQIPSRYYGDMHALDADGGQEWFAATGTMVYRYLHNTWPDPRTTGVSADEYDFWKKLFQ